MTNAYAGEKHCMNCGVGLGTTRNIQPHCDEPDCVLAWGLAYIRDNIRVDGDHHIWVGQVDSKHKTPQWAPSFVNEDGSRSKRSFRVLDALFKEATGEEHRGHPYKNLCGNRKCVNLEHNEPVYSASPYINRPSLTIKAKLPAEPLLRELDRQRNLGIAEDFPNKHRHDIIGKARKTGVITVTQADTICIDYLHMHPAELYGDLFFTVGTEPEPEALCACGCGERVRSPRSSFRPGHSTKTELADRLHAKLAPNGDCLDWTGHLHHEGHGQIQVDGKAVGAHRVAWSVNNGPIPKGAVVLHRCGNLACCNPDHLYVAKSRWSNDAAA
jgi:hypothetical protein